MSTVLIVVIVAVVLLIVSGLLLTRLPRMRERARMQKRERELEQRREQVVDEHRQEAAGRERQAEAAEQRARVAAQEAERQRAESRVAEAKAELHERGLADHELIDEDERSRFAGTSAVESVPDDPSSATSAPAREPTETPGAGAVGPRPEAGAAGDGAAGESDDDPQRRRTTAYEEGRAAAHDPSRAEDFEAGRRRAERR
ncbi:MAG TPA: hypothetical protein VFW09_18725 [Solirubrobacteraceae bacterium]|nr:hypothetical protein [Solirubrobacteraceae bacterium]